MPISKTPWKKHDRSVFDSNDRLVARCFGETTDEIDANVNIIVVAPEMLEVLENIYGGCWIDRDSYGLYVQKRITMEEYEAMGIAIKKARGEE